MISTVFGATICLDVFYFLQAKHVLSFTQHINLCESDYSNIVLDKRLMLLYNNTILNKEILVVAETRKTLFLYPKLENLDINKQIKIIDLITHLKIIVNVSNEKIARILRDSSFAYVRCLPSVNVEELCAEMLINEEVERVRVCVIGYNEASYENSYSHICEQYVQNKLNISHLVGVKINTSVNSVKFYKPEGSPFDVIIETGLFDLENILVSIMLDISIYHYFALSNEIQYRRKFSALKMNSIRESNHINEYGDNVNLSEIHYLPFTYPYVKKISEDKNGEISSIINEALDEYFEFIARYVCFDIFFDNNKELNDPYSYGGVPSDHISSLSEIVANLDTTASGNYYAIIGSSREPTIIRDNDEARFTWLSKFTRPLNDCALYYIRIGE